MISSSLSSSLLIAGLILASLALAEAEHVTSTSGIIFNCPEQETIEVAYAGYCPPMSRNEDKAYSGRSVYAFYDQAPTTWKTSADSLYLTCYYATGNDKLTCNYEAGGGEALHPQDGDPSNCPDVSGVIPQPSPGVDYRRKRADSNTPQYTCPWDSDHPQSATGYTIGSGYDTGVANPATGSDFHYYCSLGQSNSCEYDIVEGTFVANGDNIADCPTTLCTAQMTGTGNMRRGIFRDDMSIARRQVNTKSLRSKLQRR